MTLPKRLQEVHLRRLPCRVYRRDAILVTIFSLRSQEQRSSAKKREAIRLSVGTA